MTIKITPIPEDNNDLLVSIKLDLEALQVNMERLEAEFKKYNKGDNS